VFASLIKNFMQATHRARVVARQSLTPRVVELTLGFVDEAFEWAAGQYVFVRVPSVSSDLFAFSIANAHEPGNPELSLAVGDGPSSEVLSRAPLGFEVELEGPAGSLTWQDAPGALLVGAGTGVTPLYALLQEALLRDQKNVPVVLLAGARSEAEVLWSEDLLALASTSEFFDFRPALSQPSDAYTGRRGRVQAHLADAVLALPSGFAAYVCGSKAMVDECREALGRLGVVEPRLRHESY
jgi:CDP-4-dehydro-6-deoxyglucose reductase